MPLSLNWLALRLTLAHARQRGGGGGTGDGRGGGSAVPDLGAVHSVSVDILGWRKYIKLPMSLIKYFLIVVFRAPSRTNFRHSI